MDLDPELSHQFIDNFKELMSDKNYAALEKECLSTFPKDQSISFQSKTDLSRTNLYGKKLEENIRQKKIAMLIDILNDSFISNQCLDKEEKEDLVKILNFSKEAHIIKERSEKSINLLKNTVNI